MSDVYRAALIGLGKIAWRFDHGKRAPVPPLTHFGAYARNGRTQVVCGFSPDTTDREEFHSAHKVAVSDELDGVFKTKPDIVSICSPAQCHFEQTLACLKRKVPMIWLEKPPTTTLQELDELLPACKSSKTKVLVNYMRRYSERYSRLRMIYREQLLGRPLGLSIAYSRGLESNGSHFIDFVFSMLGDEARYEMTFPKTAKKAENPSFLLRFENGFEVSFSGFDATFHLNDVVLTSEHGRASVLSGGLETRVEMKSENEHHAGFYRLKGTEPKLLREDNLEDSFSAALADLIRAHETGTEPVSNLRTARNTQVVMERIRNA
jgi:predicted dehydrogenase